MNNNINWLNQREKIGMNMGLERVEKLLKILNSPEKDLKIIHVAGTNGKGSTVTMIEAILRYAGYKTGLYTSPHLLHISERIRVNGLKITEEELEEEIAYLRNLTYVHDSLISYFELLTVLALKFFKKSQCEVVILEAGLGGRLDATNTVDKIVTVLTSISWDHMDILGNSLTAITHEKTAIFRRGIPAIIAPQIELVQQIIEQEANKINAPATYIREPLSKHIKIGLIGQHQRWNAAVAIEAVKKSRLVQDEELMKECLANISFNGRFQYCFNNKLILDGAHNPDAVSTIIQTWREHYNDRTPCLIFGAMKDKDIQSMIQSLDRIAQKIFFVPIISSDRSAQPESFSRWTSRPFQIFVNVADAVNLALQEKNRLDTPPILALGSLFLVGEVLALEEIWHEFRT